MRGGRGRSDDDAGESRVELMRGTVITVTRGRCSVAVGNALVEAWLSRNAPAVVVGDRVTLEKVGRDIWMREVEERESILSRRDPGGSGEKLIAANIDVVILVVTYREPPLKPGLIDRYRAATVRGGCDLLVCMNKSDLLASDERTAAERELAQYGEAGVEAIFCSARTGEGVARVRERIRGRIAVLSGHSGVGKSSLINAMRPELTLRTATLHRALSAGRHTTTASTLYRLDEATSIIDTPGIREFALGAVDRETLADVFPDVDAQATGCRFTDCSHVHEPGCSVRQAVEEGRVDARRFEAYLRLARGE